MEKKSRTTASLKNIYFSLFSQISNIVLNYICRYVFVRTLSSEYLGVNGLFSNILTIFSLAELGIGSAIVYAMYKPIADNDVNKVQAFMKFYRKCYLIIATIIFVVGLVLLPNINFFIKGNSNIDNLKLIYLLYLIDSVSSYLFVYKSSIFNATQENYICNIYQTVCKMIMSIIMIIVLLIFKNFIIYLGVQILFKFLTNLLISKKADKHYPYINEKNSNQLSRQEEKTIFKNVYALFCNQIGNVLILGTDNIILSKYVGLRATGLYSNYYLVTSSITNFVGQIFNSMVASVGNLVVEKSKDYTLLTFERIHFLNFLLAIFSSTMFISCIKDFILFSFGSAFLLDDMTCFIILINLYLLIMKNVVGTFKYAMGIFWNDKYCTLLRAIINVIVSIVLAVKLGILGVFLGTLISDIITTFWFQPYILYKNGFGKPVGLYFKDFIMYTLCTSVSILLSLTIISFIGSKHLIIKLIVDGLIAIISVLVTVGIFFAKSENLKYFKNFVLSFFVKIKKKILRKY